MPTFIINKPEYLLFLFSSDYITRTKSIVPTLYIYVNQKLHRNRFTNARFLPVVNRIYVLNQCQNNIDITNQKSTSSATIDNNWRTVHSSYVHCFNRNLNKFLEFPGKKEIRETNGTFRLFNIQYLQTIELYSESVDVNN